MARFLLFLSLLLASIWTVPVAEVHATDSGGSIDQSDREWIREMAVALSIGDLLMDRGEYRDALAQYEELVPELKDKRYLSTRVAAEIFEKSGLAWRLLFRPGDAKIYLHNANLWYEKYDPGSAGHVEILGSLAEMAEMEGRLPTAKYLYERALAFERQTSSPDAARANRFSERAKRIEDRFSQWVTLRQTKEGTIETGKIVDMLAQIPIFSAAKDLESAIKIAIAADEQAETKLPADDPVRLVSAAMFWEVASQVKSSAADLFLEKVVNEADRLVEIWGDVLGRLHFALGAKLLADNKKESAIPHFRRCQKLLANYDYHASAVAEGVAVCLFWVALDHGDRGQYREATLRLDRLMEYASDRLGPSHPQVFDVVLLQATCAELIGREAWKYAEMRYLIVFRAVTSWDRLNSTSRLLKSTQGLVRILNEEGRASEAREILSTGLAKMEELGGSPEEVEALRKLSKTIDAP